MVTNRIQDLNDDTLVEVFNDYHSSVGYKLDRITRSLDKGTAKKIKMGELYELANSKGGKFLLEQNMLLIKEATVRESLGLKPIDKYSPTFEQIQELIDSGSKKELEDVLMYCSETTLEKIVQKAIAMPIKDLDKARLIQAYSGSDILTIIKEKEENEIQRSGPETEGDAPVRRKRVVKE